MDGPNTMSNEPVGDARKVDGKSSDLAMSRTSRQEAAIIKTKLKVVRYPFLVRSDVVERIDTYSHEREAIINKATVDSLRSATLPTCTMK